MHINYTIFPIDTLVYVEGPNGARYGKVFGHFARQRRNSAGNSRIHHYYVVELTDHHGTPTGFWDPEGQVVSHAVWHSNNVKIAY